MEYNEFLNHVAKIKGLTPAILEDAMAKIAFHESGPSTPDEDRAEKEQVGGGPGRGMFQFEMGVKGGGMIAIKRTLNYLAKLGQRRDPELWKEDKYYLAPMWLLEIAPAPNINIGSWMPEEDQKYIFLGNYLEHPKANLAQLRGGDRTIAQFWLNYHWAGPKKDRPMRLRAFNNSLRAFYKKKAGKIAVKESLSRRVKILIRG